MELILVSNKKVNIRRLSIGYWGLFSIGSLLLAIASGIFHIGNNFTKHQIEAKHYTLYIEKEKRWKSKFEKQQSNAETNKKNTEKNLDTLSAQLSTLRAHLLRLDVLGSRLVDITNISDTEFNMLTPPGLGGSPAIASIQNSLCATNFIEELQTVSQRIEDQNEKFSAIESILLGTSIQSQTLPQGNPIVGSWLSSPFGWRTDPISGKKEFHRGIDLVAAPGTNVHAVADGIVTWSGPHAGYGNMLEIDHGNNYVTRYAHNKKNLVFIGEKIVKDQNIAVIGSSGHSTGLHVHFEILQNGNHINPRKFIAKK